jgi:hypothetical protein
MTAPARDFFQNNYEGPRVPLTPVFLEPAPVPREAPQCPVPGCDRDIIPPHDHDPQEQQ